MDCVSLDLASSPDRLVSKDDEKTVQFVKSDTNGQYYLEPTHNYYQIQGQLLCTGAKNCRLFVMEIN